MYKYGEEKNPFGYIMFSLAATLLLANYLLLWLFLFNVINFNWSYQRFHLIMFSVFLLFSVILECIYFQAGYQFVFNNNSMIVSGIYGFLGGFVRPLFHGIFVIIKYIVSIIILILIGIDTSGVGFWLYGVPLLMELWLFAYFFARRKNRPHPWRWLELNIWRPFVEIFWRIAVRKYKVRNPKEVPTKVRWRDLNEGKQPEKAKEDSISLKDGDEEANDGKDEKVNEERRHSRLVRTISQHADI